VAHLTEHNVLTSRKKTEVSHWLVRVIFLTSSSTTAITTPLWWRKKHDWGPFRLNTFSAKENVNRKHFIMLHKMCYLPKHYIS